MRSKTRASESEAKIRPMTRIPAWSESDFRLSLMLSLFSYQRDLPSFPRREESNGSKFMKRVMIVFSLCIMKNDNAARSK